MAVDDENYGCSEIDGLKRTIEELQRDKKNLLKSEEMYRLFVENSMDAIWRLDDQFRFVYISQATKEILGFQSEEIVGRHLFSILTPESIDIVKRGYASRQLQLAQGQNWESSIYTVEAIHKDAHHIWVEVTVNPIFGANNRLLGFNGITRDISERRRSEAVIRQHAFRDPLTNLPNRRQFEDALERAVAQNKQTEKSFAVMFLDIDGLKKVNDQYGHVFGDALLKVMATRIRHAVRKIDFVARLAGDEFMAILPESGESSTVGFIAARLIESCRKPIVIGKEKVSIGVSIGVSFFPADADNVQTLMDHADRAMYEAKKAGGSNYKCYG